MTNKEINKREMLTLTKARGKEGVTKSGITRSHPMSNQQFQTALLDLRTEGKIFSTGERLEKELLFFATECFPETSEEEIAKKYVERNNHTKSENLQEKIIKALTEIAAEVGGALSVKYLAQKADINITSAGQFINNHKGKTVFGFKITQISHSQYSVKKVTETEEPEPPTVSTQSPPEFLFPPEPKPEEPTKPKLELTEFQKGYALGAEEGFKLAYKLLKETKLAV